MSIKPAQSDDLHIVTEIAHTTIAGIYPHYYPAGAVTCFLNYHNAETIAADIAAGYVFLCYDVPHHAVGTVTIKENEICRLFVLPQYQRRGYGTELLDFAEAVIAGHCQEIRLDASLSARNLYQKRGYIETGFHTITAENNDVLCYHTMVKQLCSQTNKHQ